jgi:hypothetical protein
VRFGVIAFRLAMPRLERVAPETVAPHMEATRALWEAIFSKT